MYTSTSLGDRVARMEPPMAGKGGVQVQNSAVSEPSGAARQMIVGCPRGQRVPVRYDVEGSLGRLTKNDMSIRGRWRSTGPRDRKERREWRDRERTGK